MSKRLLLTLLFCLPWLVSQAQETPSSVEPEPAEVQTRGEVHEFMLDNGLKLIVKEDHRAPVVVSQVWYKVGSSYEPSGLTGISHALEHMMFKGTEKYPGNEFSLIIAAEGGSQNAFTGRDYTAYYQELEKERLPISFELEADRMRGALLPEKEFTQEIRVVMEERRLRTEDDPQALTYERFNAAAHQISPYRNPIVGWMDDLEHLSAADLREWYDTWYKPNNAIVVVVGDVQPQEVLELAEKHFGPIKPGEPVPNQHRRDVKQRGTQYLTVKAPAELPYLLMGYHVPVLNTIDKENEWEPYALEVLTGILSAGDSARLAKNLVRGSEIAASAGAGYNMYGRLSSLFLLDGTPATGHTIEELKEALRKEIERLRKEPVSAEELARIKTQVVAGDVYRRDSLSAQAMQIGTLETVGLDWRLMDEYVDKISAVTAEQVHKVARMYLTEDTLTVAVLDPLPLGSGVAPPTAAQGSAIGDTNAN